MSERLAKYMARLGVCSRREAEEMIKAVFAERGDWK